MALRVEHGSDYTPHVYSCFSQRVRLKPNTTYRVGFWLNVEVGGSRGGFGIRFLPSRTVEAEEWDRRKVTASKIKIGEWVFYSENFTTESEEFFDVRFFAEGRISAWVDDVVLEEVQPPQA